MGILSLLRYRHWSRKWIVSAQSAITIEGFPRSGNSFAKSAFNSSQPEALQIATHVHSAAQVIRSVQLQVPTMVLLRAPADACLSLVALDYEIAGISPKAISTSKATATLIHNLIAYRRFYQTVLKVHDQVVIAEFSLVTSDLGKVIERINQKYGTHFETYNNCPQNDSKLFESGGFHLSPNENRNTIKAAIKSILESAKIQPHLQSAEEVYQRILKKEQLQSTNDHDH